MSTVEPLDVAEGQKGEPQKPINNTNPLFLSEEELITLTGRKIKSAQITALRKMHIQFYVNAVGKPVVPRAPIEGAAHTAQPKEQGWKSNVRF